MDEKTNGHAAGYDFVQLGNGLAETLMRAAEEQVTRAQTALDQTKALVEIIRNQVNAQAKANEDMNARFKEVGTIMLDAHRVLNGVDSSKSEVVNLQDEVHRPDRLDSLAGIRPARSGPSGKDGPRDGTDAGSYRGNSQGGDGHAELQRALAAGERPVPRDPLRS